MKSPLHDEQQQQQQQSLEIDRKVRAGTKCDQIQEQSVQFLLAASGLCLPDSPWYMYLLALAGLMGQGTCYWYMLTQEESKADSITSHGDVKWQIDDIFDILQQLAPWGFLLYLTRSDLHTEFEDMMKRVQFKRWMVALALLPTLGVALTCSAFYESAFWFFYGVLANLPASLGILVCFAYVEDFGLPDELNSVEDLLSRVGAYEAAIKTKIMWLNITFIIPNFILWFFLTMDTFWGLFDRFQGQYDDYFTATGNFAFSGLIIFFNVIFLIAFMVPPAYQTSMMNTFVADMDKKYCEAGYSKSYPGALVWLRNKELGWTVFGITMSPANLRRALSTTGALLLTCIAKFT